jgi:hypothetical protein
MIDVNRRTNERNREDRRVTGCRMTGHECKDYQSKTASNWHRYSNRNYEKKGKNIRKECLKT